MREVALPMAAEDDGAADQFFRAPVFGGHHGHGPDPTLRPRLATILRMREWADVAERVASTTRTSEKVAAVSGDLSSLASDEDLATATVFFSGRPFPERDPRTTGIGWAQIAAVAERIAGQGEGALFAAYNESSDIGSVVGDLLIAGGHDPEGRPLTVAETASTFAEVAAARGATAKAVLMADLLNRADPITARFIVR